MNSKQAQSQSGPSSRIYLKSHHLAIIAIVAITSLAIALSDVFPFEKTIVNAFHLLPGSYDAPDTNRDVFELIESRGFKHEQHHVQVSDGFIIQMVRVVNPYVQQRRSLRPVLLFHGFQCSSTLWLVAAEGHLGQDGIYYELDEAGQVRNGSREVVNTLAFVLATRGYDVWLANYRGSRYSSNHSQFGRDDPRTWSYSVDEMIGIDLPESIDYILRTTGHSRMSYVGHSQGNYIAFCMLASRPEYASKLDVVVANSPVIFFEQMITPLARLGMLKNFFMEHYGPVPNMPKLHYVYSNICNNNLIWWICHSAYKAILGSPANQIIPNRLGVYLANVPMGSAGRNAAHFLQLLEHGNPSHYDFGNETLNLARYNSTTPPLYDIGKINSTRLALIYSAKDWFNHIDTIHRLKKELTVPLFDDYLVPDESVNHMDLVWGRQVGKLVNTRILSIFDKAHSMIS